MAEAVFRGAFGDDPPRDHWLDEKIARAYPEGGWRAYYDAIARNGNPPEQIGRFEAAGIILQPKQLEFAAWARRLDDVEGLAEELGAPELGFGGAKGPGKSFVMFGQAAVDDCWRFDGLKVLYLRRVGKRALEQATDLVLAVLPHVDHKFVRDEVRFPNGSRILVGHFNNDKEALNYAGIEYDLIIIEETTHLSEATYKALRQSARSSKIGWRPRLYNGTNPLGVGHNWYKKRFVDHERRHKQVQDRKRKFIFATVLDNHFVNDEYIGNLQELTGAQKRAYLDGDWDVSAGAYFENFNRHLHEIDPISPALHWDVWASMDYGYNHWNVIYLHAMDDDGIVYTFDEIRHRKYHPDQIVPELAERAEGYGLTLNKLSPFYAGTDVFAKTGAARKTVAEQYKALGIKLTMADTGPGSRVAGAHHLSKLLGNPEQDVAPTWFITSNCAMLLETMGYLEVDPHNPEDVLKVDCDGDTGEGGDDAYDAARYGLKRTRRSKARHGTGASKYA